MKLEVCVDDHAGLQAAVEGGADRVELCAALALGGVAPSAALVRAAAETKVPVRLLARPRDGDFIYDRIEAAQVAQEMTIAAEMGLEGVVIGASRADRSLDVELIASWVAHARALGAARGAPLGLTLHRAFDLCPDLDGALEAAVALGFDRILTSGGAPRAIDGLGALRRLSERAAGRIAIMAGSGVNVDNVGQFIAAGVDEVHASCRVAAGVDPVLERKFGFAAGPRRTVQAEAVATLRAEAMRLASGKN